ncbi:MAG: iron-sulfur cluster carrier protein ApbC [Pseudomonadota bacterium]|nr:iron-sulfur cluster carrier protein ApbC [Pseudomonadota bacterium]
MEELIRKITAKYYPADSIDSIKIAGGRAIITLVNATEDEAKTAALKAEAAAVDGIAKATVIFTAAKAFNGLRQENEMWHIRNVKKIIAVASGKGGVGKSTTAVNLALALSNQNKKVALFDADIYGPSIPTMLGYEGTAPATTDGKTFEPFVNLGLESMSVGTLIDRSQPLIWRGAKACGAMQQLLTDTNWGDIDIMVIDMPPGTGDIQITLSQKVKTDGAVIVSTPQDIALIDAVKGINMFKRVNVPILGIIENMSYYICEKCGHRADIFGHEGAKKTAEAMGETFLGEIPLHYAIRENADNGTPIVFADPDSPHTQAYEEIAKKIIAKLSA